MARRALHLAFLVTLTVSAFWPAFSAGAESQGRFYAETGYTISPHFVDYWDSRGGLRIFGFPITGEVEEGGLPVQYFERARFEFHAAADPANQVQLGLLGNALTLDPQAFPEVPPFPGREESAFYRETGHSLSFGFLRFWRENGGLPVFGFPISEESSLPARGGGPPVTVQWFERARFEYHSDFPAEYRVSLGLVGREYLDLPTSSTLRRIWIEGEQPGESNFSWTVAYGGLSGSSALFLYSPVPPGPEGRFATYQVDVPETAICTLWSREFALDWASPSLWRFDDQLWKRADGTTPAIDPVVVSGENHVYSWYRYGKVLLEAGTHTLQIKVTEPRTLGQSSSTDGLYLKMMDAFLLTSDSTVPLGIIPPAGTLPAQIPPSSLQLTVDTQRALGPWRHLERSLAQGSYYPDPSFLENTIPRMRDLKVEMIRLDHLFDHYDVYQRDASGNVTYHWEKLDQMVDSVLAMGAKPLMSLSYMPLAISADGSEKSPPADFAAWRNLVYEAVKHFNLDRKLGIVYWEIWNEPNLSSTWHSDLETYLQLYDAAAQAIRAADPAAKVGGPGVAGFEERWIYTLISHVAEKGLPFDFLSWHLYGVQPPMIKPQVLLARSWLSRFPQLGDTQLFLDEWSVYNGGVDDTSWNGISDTEYAAAYIAAMTSELTRQGLDGSMLFAVKDAHTNDDRTFSGRWGVLSNSGAPKASYNALKALSLLGDTELSVTGGGSHVGAVATRQGDKVAVLLWNLGNPFQAEGSQEIELSLEGLAGQQAFQRYLIDATHSNGRYSIDHAELELVESGAASAGTHQQKLSLPDNSVTLLLFSPQ